jgi:hypothetical protein
MRCSIHSKMQLPQRHTYIKAERSYINYVVDDDQGRLLAAIVRASISEPERVTVAMGRNVIFVQAALSLYMYLLVKFSIQNPNRMGGGGGGKNEFTGDG